MPPGITTFQINRSISHKSCYSQRQGCLQVVKLITNCICNCMLLIRTISRFFSRNVKCNFMSSCLWQRPTQATATVLLACPSLNTMPVPALKIQIHRQQWNYGFLFVPVLFDSPGGRIKEGGSIRTRAKPRLFSPLTPVEMQNLGMHEICVVTECTISVCSSSSYKAFLFYLYSHI